MVPIVRLSPADLTNLAVETPDSPMHQAALGVLEGKAMFDAEGHVRIDEVRAHLESRLGRVPELRRIVHQTGLFGGRPLWVDDPTFRIENHVLAARLPEPGGEAQLLAFAEQRMATLMDRSRPLWEVWLLEGYAPNRAGMLIKLHHALADGPAMVNLVGQIFDLEPGLVHEAIPPWSPAPPPSRSELVRDNLFGKAVWVARAAARLRHPARLIRSAAVVYRGVAAGMRQGRGAPRTSFNRPTGIGRRIAVTRLSLDEVKAVAHAQGVKLNDVFMYLVARGLREVLMTRGEPVHEVRMRASMAVSLHRTGDATTSGNQVGTVIVPLPMDDASPREVLAIIAAASADAKRTQRAITTSGLMVLLAATGLTRLFIRHQHLINVLTTNLPGPPVPMYFAGARLYDVVALAPLAGNVTASFAALSYDGTLCLSVQADERAWPDLGVLLEGMRAGWLALRAAAGYPVPAAEGTTALSA